MSLDQDRVIKGQDGSTRKAHYGDGKQPWDIIVENGWGPAFAAANVLKYIRRTKNVEHSFESACWYYRQLVEETDRERKIAMEWHGKVWTLALAKLVGLLTPEERNRIVAVLVAEDKAKGIRR